VPAWSFMGRREISCALIRTPVRSARSQVTISTTLSRLHVLLLLLLLAVVVVVLPVVQYGCETWSLTLREERRLRVLIGC